MADYSFKNKAWTLTAESRRKQQKSVKQIVQLEQYSKVPSSVPTCTWRIFRISFLLWFLFSLLTPCLEDTSIDAAPSSFPPRKYCDLTGFEAPYTDPRSGLRFSSVAAYRFLQELPEYSRYQLLGLRNAAPVLR
jgi:hypothetical protein